jgi:hypothetical protein
MNKHTLEAAPAAGAKELKTPKTAKAKRIVVGSDDVHKNSYQVARKVDSGDLPSKTRTGYWLIID